jgi:anti-sigma factor RsiW
VPCSSSEALLDEYLEGTLRPEASLRVAAHLARCASCGSLLEELRVIDALLVTAPRREPAPNFTFDLMAELRGLPQPYVRRAPILGVAAAYLVFAWVLISAFFTFGGGNAKAALVVIVASLGRYGEALDGLAGATAHLFGDATFGITAAMSAILALDLLAVALAVVFHGIRRGRLGAAAGWPRV